VGKKRSAFIQVSRARHSGDFLIHRGLKPHG
jgi:hypothetical protein